MFPWRLVYISEVPSISETSPRLFSKGLNTQAIQKIRLEHLRVPHGRDKGLVWFCFKSELWLQITSYKKPNSDV